MKNIKRIGMSLAIGIGLVFSGCATRQPFNPGITMVGFHGEDAYKIPVNSSFFKLDSLKAYSAKANNMNCNEGDALWIELDFYNKHLKPFTKEHPYFQHDIFSNNPWRERFSEILKKNGTDFTTTDDALVGGAYRYYPYAYAAQKDLAGCVAPMSAREYEHETGKAMQQRQHQHDSNMQSKKDFQQALNRLNDTANSMKPINVNVYHY